MESLRLKFTVLFLIVILMLRGQSDSLYVFSKPAMGTLFQLHFYAEKEVNPELIAEKVFERIIHLDYVLSDYKEDAEVYQLNIRQPLEWQDISAELGFVLENSIKWSKISGHFFDPALGSLTHLWRRARRRNEFPADSLQSMAKNNVGIQHIALRKKDNQYQFKFKKKGVKLDFGGIGKGYAVDEALKICKHLGVRSAMISAGSTLAVGKAPPLKKGWLIKPDTALFSFAQNRYIKHTTQSISGDQQQFLEWEGKRYSHLLHPLTGKPLTEGTTCLVEGPDGLITDALGTAFSLMDQEGMKRILLFRKRIKVICKRGNQLIDIHWKNK